MKGKSRWLLRYVCVQLIVPLTSHGLVSIVNNFSMEYYRTVVLLFVNVGVGVGETS